MEPYRDVRLFVAFLDLTGMWSGMDGTLDIYMEM